MTSLQLRRSFVGLGALLVAFGLIGLPQGGNGFALGLPAVVVGLVILATSLPLAFPAR